MKKVKKELSKRLEKQDAKLFNRVAYKYAKKHIVPSSREARKAGLLLAIQPLLDKNKNLGTIVDIGCGIGATAKYLSGHYNRYIGIDQSKKMIEYAKSLHKLNPKAEFIAKNIKDKGLPKNIADVILLLGALHHMTELDKAMKAILRIGKPGATIVAIEPHAGNPLIRFMRKIRGYIDSSYSKKQISFSSKDLYHIFKKNKLSNINIDYHGFFKPPFAQVVMYPQVIFYPLSKMAINLDKWLHKHSPLFLRKLSFNLVVIAKINK